MSGSAGLLADGLECAVAAAAAEVAPESAPESAWGTAVALAVAADARAAGSRPTVTSGHHLRLIVPPCWEDTQGCSTATGEGTQMVKGQQVLDLPFVLACGLPTAPPVPGDVRIPGPRRWPYGIEPRDDTPTSRADLPPAGPWVARLAQAVLEVCSAGRPVAQLMRWTSQEVFEDLQGRYLPRAKRNVSRRKICVSESVCSVHVCEPADGVAEASVLVKGGERPRALALRIEGWRGRWICTALDWI